MQILKSHTDRVWQCSWHPSGSILASCGGDKKICIWKDCGKDKMELVQILDQLHTKTIRTVSFSPDGLYLASGGFDSIIGIWRIDDGKLKLVQKLEGHDFEVKCVNWSYDSKYLASCSRDKTVWIWDKEEGEFQCNSSIMVHTQDVKYVKWSNDSYILYSCGYDNQIIEYNLIDDEFIDIQDKSINEHDNTVWCLDIFQNLLVSVSADLSIKIFKRTQETNQLIQNIIGYSIEPIYSCCFSKDGQQLAIGSGDNKVTIFIRDGDDEFENPKYVYLNSYQFEMDINCVQFNGDKLAICNDNGYIYILIQ